MLMVGIFTYLSVSNVASNAAGNGLLIDDAEHKSAVIGLADDENFTQDFVKNDLNSGESINEYDLYVELKEEAKKLETERSTTISKEKLDFVINNGVEKELEKRKELSDVELYEYGYDNEDIQILREYNGEAIESVPELSKVLAKMTTNFNSLTATDDVQSIKLRWNWNKVPLFLGQDEIGSIFYDSFTNITVLQNYSQYPSQVIVNYGIIDNNGSFKLRKNQRFYAYDMNKSNIRYRFPMLKRIPGGGDDRAFALNGTMWLSVGTKGRHSITEYHFKANYAHK